MRRSNVMLVVPVLGLALGVPLALRGWEGLGSVLMFLEEQGPRLMGVIVVGLSIAVLVRQARAHSAAPPQPPGISHPSEASPPEVTPVSRPPPSPVGKFPRYRRLFVWVVGGLGALTALLSLIAGAVANFKSPDLLQGLRPWLQIFVGLWVLVPPLWFWAEYSFLFSEDEKLDEALMRRLKEAQELASKVWIAVGLVLGAIAFGNRLP